MRYRYFMMLLLLLLLAPVAFTQTYSLQKDTCAYGLSGLDQIPFYQTDSMTIHGIDVPPLVTPDWSRILDAASNRHVIVIFDYYNRSLDAWFVQDSIPGVGILQGADRIRFTENDLLFGTTQLLPPLLPAQNDRTDTLRSSIVCLDRSFNCLRYYSFEWSSFSVVEDSTTELGWYGGQYGPAVYCEGDTAGNAECYLFFKPTANSWRFFGEDSTLMSEYTLYNHTGFYHYAAGAAVPVADSAGTLQFIMLHPRTAWLNRFHIGYNMKLFYTDTNEPDRPTLLATYPMDDWPTEVTDTTDSRDYYRYPQMMWPPLEVDRLGQLWFAPPAPETIFVIPEAHFPDRDRGNAPAPTHQELTIPTSFPNGTANVLFIDGTRSGQVTLLMSGGIETFQVVVY